MNKPTDPKDVAECIAAPAIQNAPSRLHNNPPDPISIAVQEMAALVGPRRKQKPTAFKSTAPWVRFATKIELRILSRIQGRIERMELRLKETRAQRTRIMNRCIKEMRRSEGKN